MPNNVMNMDGSFKPFRAWCQHVLPLVYDDSLSYMELLNKVIVYINNFGEYLEEFSAINEVKYGGPWDVTKQYTPNTVVSVGDTGYMSIKPVPAGIDINNTDYWLKVADFAGQVVDLGVRVIALEGEMTTAETDIDNLETRMGTAESNISSIGGRVTTAEGDIDTLESQVSALNSKVTAMKNRDIEYWKNANVLFIGDSYTGGYNGTTTVNSFVEYMNANLHFNTYYKLGEGGAKFSSVTGNHFYTETVDFVANHSAQVCESITDIFILGGYNDFPADSEDDIISNNSFGINTTISYLKEHFPNAVIKIGMIGRALYATQFEPNFPKFNKVVRAYKKGALLNGVEYLEGSELIMHDYRMFASDRVHPSTEGYEYLGNMLTELVLNKDFDYLYTPNATNIFNLNFTNSNFDSCPFIMYQTLTKGGVTLDIYGGQHNIATPIPTWDAAYVNKVYIGDMINASGVNMFLPIYDVYIPVEIGIKHNDGCDNVGGFIMIGYDHKVYLCCTCLNSATFSYKRFTNVTNLVIGKASHTIPLELC